MVTGVVVCGIDGSVEMASGTKEGVSTASATEGSIAETDI
jgi:hypothetical protein